MAKPNPRWNTPGIKVGDFFDTRNKLANQNDEILDRYTEIEKLGDMDLFEAQHAMSALYRSMMDQSNELMKSSKYTDHKYDDRWLRDKVWDFRHRYENMSYSRQNSIDKEIQKRQRYGGHWIRSKQGISHFIPWNPRRNDGD